jgi:hypothetical protein
MVEPYHVNAKEAPPSRADLSRLHILWLESKSGNWTVWLVISMLFFASSIFVVIADSDEEIGELADHVDSIFPGMAFISAFFMGICSKKRQGDLRIPFAVVPLLLLLPTSIPVFGETVWGSILDIHDNYPSLIAFSCSVALNFIAGYFLFRADGGATCYSERFPDAMGLFPSYHEEGVSFYSNIQPMMLFISLSGGISLLITREITAIFSMITPIMFIGMFQFSLRIDDRIIDAPDPYGPEACAEGWWDGILHEVREHKHYVQVHIGTLRKHYSSPPNQFLAVVLAGAMVYLLSQWYQLSSTDLTDGVYGAICGFLMFMILIPGTTAKTTRKILEKEWSGEGDT